MGVATSKRMAEPGPRLRDPHETIPRKHRETPQLAVELANRESVTAWRDLLVGGVFEGGHVVCLIDRKCAAAQEASFLVGEARQLVENFGQGHVR